MIYQKTDTTELNKKPSNCTNLLSIHRVYTEKGIQKSKDVQNNKTNINIGSFKKRSERTLFFKHQAKNSYLAGETEDVYKNNW